MYLVGGSTSIMAVMVMMEVTSAMMVVTVMMEVTSTMTVIHVSLIMMVKMLIFGSHHHWAVCW